MKIKGFFKDWFGIARIMSARQKSINKANNKKNRKIPEINKVALALHPGELKAKLIEIFNISEEAKRFRFKSIDISKNIPYFEAGEYLTIEVKIGDKGESFLWHSKKAKKTSTFIGYSRKSSEDLINNELLKYKNLYSK